MNILFVTAHFPYPLIGGERIKQFYILQCLAEHHNVFLVSFDRGHPVSDKDIRKIRNMDVSVNLITLNIKHAYLNASLYSPLGKPLEIEFFRNKSFRKAVDNIIYNNNIDIAISFFMRTAEYIRNHNFKKILIAEDCRYCYQKHTYRETNNFKEKLIRLYEYKKLKRYESELMNDFDVTTLVSNNDITEMKKLNPEADIRLLSNGVDCNEFRPPPNNLKRSGILFLGRLDMHHNYLMTLKIIKIIFPLIENRIPDVNLDIVGSNPPAEIFKYQSKNIRIHADVNDIIAFYQSAAVFLHPHSGGSGIQNKALQAMACGCPLVTTPSGARGIDIKNEVHAFIAESDNEIANLAIRILNNQDDANNISTNARELISNKYSWCSVYSSMNNILSDLS
jgi:glycosyltransferase involved in cell wall biosynthesis